MPLNPKAKPPEAATTTVPVPPGADGKVAFHYQGKLVRAKIKEISPDSTTCVVELDDGTLVYSVQIAKAKPKSGDYVLQPS